MSLFNLKSRHPWLFVLLFAIGVTSKYDLTLIARIPMSELIAFASLPFVLRGDSINRFIHRLWPVVFILLLWVFGILISDIVNGFSAAGFIRSFAKPVWCLLWLLFFMAVLHKDFRSLLCYPAGTILAAVQNYFFPQEWTIDRISSGGYEMSAYGFAPMLTAVFITLALALYRKGRWWAITFFAMNSIFLGVVGAPRNQIALMLLNCLIMFYIFWTRRQGGRVYRLNFGRLVAFGFLVFFCCWVIYEGYLYLAASGLLGEMQQAKLIGQSDTVFGDSILGLILGGRTAVFGAILAIIDTPFIGCGSWRAWTFSEYYYDAIAYVGTDARELTNFANSSDFFTPGHSILFTAWMENGILAAVALGIIFYLIMREFLFTIQRDSRLAPLLIAFATSFAWAFFFSPFGTAHRMVIGLFLALNVLKINKLKNLTS